jgi:hypothetical protein
LLLLATAASLVAPPAAAQDANFLYPPLLIEARLRDAQLNLIDARGARAPGDRTMRIALDLGGDTTLLAQLAKAAPGASTFNNEPRYELAAYAIQKLFLGPDEYVVPPTVIRAVPTTWLRKYDEEAASTFDGTASTLIVLQYWLLSVTDEDVWDRDRVRSDTVYARHVGNLNILTYLIRHNDSNKGNFLISTYAANPRVYAVDNGLAFRSELSDRGYEWRRLRVERLPHATVARLRAISDQDLESLGVLVQFEEQGGLLAPVPVGPNLNPSRGVRHEDGIVQLGLTRAEIGDLRSRLQSLLKDVDEGKLTVF